MKRIRVCLIIVILIMAIAGISLEVCIYAIPLNKNLNAVVTALLAFDFGLLLSYVLLKREQK